MLVFQILAVGGVFQVLNLTNSWAFMVFGKSREVLRASILTKPLAVLFVLLGSQFGLEGAAVGFAGGLASNWLVNLIFLSRTTTLSVGGFLSNAAMLLSVSVFGGIAAWVASTQVAHSWNAGISIVLGLLACTCVMFGLFMAIPPAKRQLQYSVTVTKQALRKS